MSDDVRGSNGSRSGGGSSVPGGTNSKVGSFSAAQLEKQHQLRTYGDDSNQQYDPVLFDLLEQLDI